MAADATPETPLVLVDSNLIVNAAWLLDTSEWTVLLHQARSGRMRLAVPEVVLREVIARYESVLNGALGKARSALGNLRALTTADIEDVSFLDVAATAAAYKDQLRQKLADSRVEIPGLDLVSVDELVERAVARVPPFNKDGNGFRDAIVWLALLATAEELTAAPVVLLSNDRKAFYDGEALHPTLAAEADERGLGSIAVHTSIRDYLVGRGVSDIELQSGLIDALTMHREAVNKEIERHLLLAELPTSDRAFTATVIGVHEVSVLFANGYVNAAADDLALVELEVSADLDIEVRFEADDPEFVASTHDLRLRMDLVLAHHFAPRMIERGRGGIAIVASNAATQGSINFSTYSAGKAFEWILVESLWSELGDHGIDVATVLSGPIASPNYLEYQKTLDRELCSRPESPELLDRARARLMSPSEPRDVALALLDGLGHGPVHYAHPLDEDVSRTCFTLARTDAIALKRAYHETPKIDRAGLVSADDAGASESSLE